MEMKSSSEKWVAKIFGFNRNNVKIGCGILGERNRACGNRKCINEYSKRDNDCQKENVKDMEFKKFHYCLSYLGEEGLGSLPLHYVINM
jgi:hypothetical protein